MKIKPLIWDSNFFDKNIGELLINDENKLIKFDEKFDLVYVKTINEETLQVEGYELSYQECKVVFSKKDLSKKHTSNINIISAFQTNFNPNQLYKLAYESGKYSRFKLDRNFTKTDFINLYKRWIDNSLNKLFADEVLLYLNENIIIGFITYSIYKTYAKIGLFAIDSQWQGQGVGSELINRVESELLEKKIKELRVSTQLKNKNACDFYLKNGYAIKNKTIIKHYWQNDTL